MLMAFTSVLNFSFSVSDISSYIEKIFFCMILAFSKSTVLNLILLTLTSLFDFLTLFPQLKFYLTFHLPIFPPSLHHLCRIKQLKIFLDSFTIQLLVFSFILSFDYCNSLYYGLPRPDYTFSQAFNSASFFFLVLKKSCV